MVLRRLRLYGDGLTVDDDRLILQHCVARAIGEPHMGISFTSEFFPNR